MKRHLLLPFALFAACATSPDPRREPAVEAAAREKDLREDDAKRRDFKAVLVRLDQAIDSYVKALADQGEFRADQQQERLYKIVHETVMDIGPVLATKGMPAPRPGETFARLQALATDGSNPDAQAIALSALGFSGNLEVMPTILQGAQLSDSFLVDHAVLGLAVLKAPNTPPGVLAAVVERADHREDGRVQAAWAIYRIQTATERTQPIVEIWQRFLANRDTLPVGVLVNAVRGLGLTRNAAHADAVAEVLKHPTGQVRMAAALALGRLNAQTHWPQLVEMLHPSETVPNVRLTARKALAALAGGTDHEYDIEAWRKTFDRGSR